MTDARVIIVLCSRVTTHATDMERCKILPCRNRSIMVLAKAGDSQP